MKNPKNQNSLPHFSLALGTTAAATGLVAALLPSPAAPVTATFFATCLVSTGLLGAHLLRLRKEVRSLANLCENIGNQNKNLKKRLKSGNRQTGHKFKRNKRSPQQSPKPRVRKESPANGKSVSPAEADASLTPLLTSCLIIDSNLWMAPDYDSFFTRFASVCRDQQATFNIPGVQFDEIVNIKKNSPYGTPRSHRARLALSRIESLQSEGILTIEDMGIQRNPEAYADDTILETLAQSAGRGQSCTLLTLDRELRLRARQVLRDGSTGEATWSVPDPADLLRLSNGSASRESKAA